MKKIKNKRKYDINNSIEEIKVKIMEIKKDGIHNGTYSGQNYIKFICEDIKNEKLENFKLIENYEINLDWESKKYLEKFKNIDEMKCEMRRKFFIIKYSLKGRYILGIKNIPN